ncbi:MAG: hypothetical protein ACYS8W_14035 [Planctomycetota bacterium]|jgi:hypothetical protein
MPGRNHPGQEDVIDSPRGKFVRSPRKPFPWWGPFNGVEAIGRSVLLFGLVGLGALFIGLLTKQTIVEGGPFAGMRIQPTISLAEIIGILFTICLIGAGSGILLRKNWGIVFLKILLVVFAVVLGIFIVFSLYGLLRSPGGFLLAFPSMGGMALALLAMIFSLWRYWSYPSVRYEFGHVRINELKNTSQKTSILFGVTVGLYGLAWALISSQFILVGFLGGVFMLIILTLIGISVMIAIGGFLYQKRSNGGRIILIVMSGIGMLLMFASIIFAMAMLGFSPQNTMSTPLPILASGAHTLFHLLSLCYVLFEIIRFMLTDKAKAWTRRGRYIPPWMEQIKTAEAMEEAEQAVRPPAPGE